MNQRIVVLGGGIGGTAAAIALVRRGRAVTVIERDPPPDPGLDPFLAWRRRGVPQFRQPHGFSARARNLLAAHAPDVLQRLRAGGVEEINLFKRLIPEELWEPTDDTFTNIWARRAVFELALRLTAQAERGVEFLCPAVAMGVTLDRSSAQPPRVSGVRLTDGRKVEAGLVLDCGGQRSPVPRWLIANEVHVPADIQDCETIYYSRYFRFKPGCGLPRESVATLRGEFPGGSFVGFPGDANTFAFAFECHPDRQDARRLRHVEEWEATARSIEAVTPWVDPANSTPLGGVHVMAGNRNLRRHYVIDSRPVILGLLPVGDSLCATNPAYGWGSAMALTYAFIAAEMIDRHSPDLLALAVAYEEAVGIEADAIYREAAAMDRARIYRITGQDVPEHDRAEMERQDLIAQALAGGVLHDIDMGRAFCRRVNLVGPADVVLDGSDLVGAARRRLSSDAGNGKVAPYQRRS
jgi:2-polyprenyl-6-methoxyphenol hydroxylase-like FAD-dependent oxidoreductase